MNKWWRYVISVSVFMPLVFSSCSDGNRASIRELERGETLVIFDRVNTNTIIVQATSNDATSVLVWQDDQTEFAYDCKEGKTGYTFSHHVDDCEKMLFDRDGDGLPDCFIVRSNSAVIARGTVSNRWVYDKDFK